MKEIQNEIEEKEERLATAALIDWTGERYVPWVEIETPVIHYEHLHRYYFATQFVAGRKVLDLASGEGYGCAILAGEALQVVGVDLDELAVKHAARRYSLPNLEFLQGSITEVPIEGEKLFDVITCFEAIEHIEEHDRLLAEVARLVKDDGLLVLSSPNKLLYTDQSGGHNPYHVKELYFNEFRKLLGKHFNHVKFLGQKVLPMSAIWPLGERRGSYEDFCVRKSDRAFLPTEIRDKIPLYFIAIASRAPLPDQTSFSTLTDVSEELFNSWQRRVTRQDLAIGSLNSELTEKAELLAARGREVAEQEQVVKSLNTHLREKDQELKTSTLQIAEQEQVLKALNTQLTEKHHELQTLRLQAADQEQTVSKFSLQRDEQEQAMSALLAQVDEQEQAVRTLSVQRDEQQQAAQILREQLAGRTSEIQAIATRLGEEEKVASALSERVTEKDQALHALSLQLAELTQSNRVLEMQGVENKRMVDTLSHLLVEKEHSVRSLQSHFAAGRTELLQRLTEGASRLDDQDRHLREMARLLEEKERINIQRTEDFASSGSYRLGRALSWPLRKAKQGLRISTNGVQPVDSPSPSGLVPQLPTPGSELQPAHVAQGPSRRLRQDTIHIERVMPVPSLVAHRDSIDIIVCVHNALEDVKRCLDAIVRYTRQPYSLIVVDDGSNMETHSYLSQFVAVQVAKLLTNAQAKGYTFAANQGLRESAADLVVLLNSDTVVTSDWLDRMSECAESDSQIGLIGPLSNAASWQSVPQIISDGDFAENPLPDGMTVSEVGKFVAKHSGRLYPRLPFLNGFCLMIKRQVLEQVGYFDEVVFGRGYGEENDYCLRARKAGWQCAVVDDAYVYHAQSRSYSPERRKELCKYADEALLAKHGRQIVDDGVAVCRFDRVLEGIRARSQTMSTRHQLATDGRLAWAGRRVLFVLPVMASGGGGNVVIAEAEAIQIMGVDVRILNLSAFRTDFERSYPDLTIPVIYAEKEQDIPGLMQDFDAVIATACHSVYWLQVSTSNRKPPIRGYYVQDFEPYFFNGGSAEFEIAWHSYTLYPDLLRITKTEWNRDIVMEKVGAGSTVIGQSVDIDLFRPRRRKEQSWPQRPLRIAAMIRPSSPRRAPELTLEVLRDLYNASQRGDTVEIILFGCETDELKMIRFANEFPWRNAGMLHRAQVASLLNEVDVFVDFSSFQAMGLTAMEAMSCGVAVIVPVAGGATSYARHEENSLVIDTKSKENCLVALERLVTDAELRKRLQRQALFDICEFYPERAAYNLLETLFQQQHKV